MFTLQIGFEPILLWGGGGGGGLSLEVNVNSKEENSYDFFRITSNNSASVQSVFRVHSNIKSSILQLSLNSLSDIFTY
jgi:hypothetical protein